MDLDEKIRFRVLTQSFTESAPVQKEALMAAVANKMNGLGSGLTASTGMAVEAVGEAVPTVAPYRIVATVAEDGLGLLSWWS